jgi:hypothetical protein
MNVEFLYNDPNKYVPINFVKTNYGFSNSNPDISSTVDSTLDKVQKLPVEFPFDTASIVILVDKLTDTISEIQSSAPGNTTVTVTLKGDNDYWIYVVNKDSDDGYVRQDYAVDPEATVSSRAEFSVGGNTTPAVLDMTVAGRLPDALDDTDATKWYNYDGSYTGPLLWESVGGLTGEGGDNTQLIYLRDIISDIIDIFVNEGAILDDGTLNTSILLWGAHDKIVTHIARVKADPVLIQYPRIRDFVSYMDLQLKESYVQDGYVASDMVEGALVNHFYGARSSSAYNSGFLFNFDFGPYGNAGEDSRTPKDEYYDTTRNLTRKQGNANLYAKNYKSSIETFNSIRGATAKVYDSDWNRAPGDPDDWEGHAVRREIGYNIGRQVRDDAETFNDRLDSFDIPRVSNADNINSSSTGLLTEKVASFASIIRSNILDYSVMELNKVDDEIVALGDFIFSDIDHRGRDVLGWEKITTRTPPAWWQAETKNILYLDGGEPNVEDFRLSAWISVILQDKFVPMEKELWETTEWNLQEVANIIGLQPIFGIDKPAFPNYLTEEGMQSLRSTISRNASKVWTPIYAEDDEPIDDGHQYLGQLAIMQNIGFLKSLVESVNDNLWTTVNNTNSIMLSSLMGIEEKLGDDNESNTIMNVVGTNTPLGSINVEHTPYPYTGSSELNNAIIDRGEMKILDLSSNAFDEVGKHVIYISPTKKDVQISEQKGNIVTIPDGLNEFRLLNYFHGWNIEFFDSDGTSLGKQKLVTASYRNEAGQHLKVSPFVSGEELTIDGGIRAKLWSNDFIPILVTVDIVQQNALTLSYNMYSTKEINTETGVCTIYDYNGNVYKRLTVGTYANDESGRSIIEYRAPIIEGDVTDINDLTNKGN